VILHDVWGLSVPAEFVLVVRGMRVSGARTKERGGYDRNIVRSYPPRGFTAYCDFMRRFNFNEAARPALTAQRIALRCSARVIAYSTASSVG
jgi:hypothetical protein